METTTQETALPAVISTGIEQVKNLGTVYRLNNELLAKAEAACKSKIEAAEQLDLTKVDAEKMEFIDQDLVALATKLSDAKTKCEERRKPATNALRDVVTAFTTIENSFENSKVRIKAIRDLWAKEKNRRQQVEAKKAQDKLNKEHEIINFRASVKIAIRKAVSEVVTNAIAKINKNFEGTTLENIEAFKKTMNDYKPGFTLDAYNKAIDSLSTPFAAIYNTDAEGLAVVSEVKPQSFEEMKGFYESSMNSAKDNVLSLIPGRIAQLEEIQAASKNKKKQAELKEAADKALAEQAEAHNQQILNYQLKASQADAEQAEIDKMGAMFDNVPTTGGLTQSKGTVTKKCYEATSLAAWAAMLQLYITKQMPVMGLEEIEKKFGFVKTFAEKKLNEGEELKANGLKVVDDFSTRATRAKKTV